MARLLQWNNHTFSINLKISRKAEFEKFLLANLDPSVNFFVNSTLIQICILFIQIRPWLPWYIGGETRNDPMMTTCNISRIKRGNSTNVSVSSTIKRRRITLHAPRLSPRNEKKKRNETENRVSYIVIHYSEKLIVSGKVSAEKDD